MRILRKHTIKKIIENITCKYSRIDFRDEYYFGGIKYLSMDLDGIKCNFLNIYEK